MKTNRAVTLLIAAVLLLAPAAVRAQQRLQSPGAPSLTRFSNSIEAPRQHPVSLVARAELARAVAAPALPPASDTVAAAADPILVVTPRRTRPLRAPPLA